MTAAELADLLTRADSTLSLIRHRCAVLIPWGTSAAPDLYEVDRLIGELRRRSDEYRRAADEASL